MLSNSYRQAAPSVFARTVVALVALLGSTGLLAKGAAAQDFQFVALGNGTKDAACIKPGPNGVLDSLPTQGDDQDFGEILTGDDGICDTPLAGDDVNHENGVVFGQGLPFGDVILSGSPLNNNGICADPIVALGDDVIETPSGQSLPHMVAVGPGANGSVESTPSGDDVVTGLICPGGDGFQSSLDPADDFPIQSQRCLQLCTNSLSCIVPGNDGLLQTVPDPLDVLVPYVSSGPDGIGNSTATGDDVQVIATNFGFVGTVGFERTVCVNAGPNGIAETSVCGNGIVDLEENAIFGPDCEDGNTVGGDGCSAICELEPFCGDGTVDPGEECDDGNTVGGDGCSPICELEPFCGDGVIDPGEECDDGNTRNNDACVVGCADAVCGDGFLWRGVEQCEPPSTPTCDDGCLAIVPPGCGNEVIDPPEDCDDGNASNKDDCTNSCENSRCGDGFIHDKGTPPFEECDDHNIAPGDGCNPSCELECGNGVLDGVCTEGTVGLACSVSADCDSSPSAGDGVCVGETCDPGAANLCIAGPVVCSNVCQIASCGNSEVECDEECDLGPSNGVSGSGCAADCTRTVVGRAELRRPWECLSAWTLDSAPRPLNRHRQVCNDGDLTCDFDTISGQCTFHVGVCLNRPGVPGCDPGGLLSWDLRRVNITEPQKATATETLTDAVAGLSSGTRDKDCPIPSVLPCTQVPDRCRRGLRFKSCTIPHNFECDRTFGAANGFCDIGTGVLFFPNLDPADQGGDQLLPCTTGVDVVVQAGTRLRLKSWTRRVIGRGDRDGMRLICQRSSP